MEQIEQIYEYAEILGCKTERNVSMSSLTTFKTGGNADVVISPVDCSSLKKIVKKCYESDIKPFIIGNGSNLLISDNGIKVPVIHIGKGFDEIKLIDSETVECLAGCSLIRLCRFALENGLTGLEFAYGIPGSVGGAVYMNAGAYGGEMKDVLFESEHINPDGSTGKYGKDELDLSYRHSAYSNGDKIITKITLKLQKGSKTEIEVKMNELMQRRKDKQPLEYPSAGSTFKRPEGYFAGKLIEDCGLKGASVGGAQVSEKHCGFVINRNNATTNDIISLIGHIKKTVFDKTGVMLEAEVKIID